jgi:hypothetical protein
MLRLSWGARILSLLLLAAPVGVALWARDVSEVGPILAPAAIAFGCVVCVVAVLGWGWWVDERGLERRSLLEKRVRIEWGDVVSVHASAVECVIRARYGWSQRFRASTAGYDVLARHVLEHVRSLGPAGDPTRQFLERAAGRPPQETTGLLVLPPDPPAPGTAATERLQSNPFYVLGLRPDCGAAEVERAGQKLLGLLALDIASARSYKAPLGTAPRTPEKVRAAMAELRDPDRRLLHEVWASPPASGDDGAVAASAPADPAPDAGWPDAMSALGWRAQ